MTKTIIMLIGETTGKKEKKKKERKSFIITSRVATKIKYSKIRIESERRE
jgi:hypothetical protein